MAYIARSGSDDHTLPTVRPRIIGGRLVTSIELPQQQRPIENANKSNGKANQNNQFSRTADAKFGNSVANQNLQDMYARLHSESKDGQLPRRPLELPEAQHLLLLQEVDRALSGQANPDRLKQCYLELTTFDRMLSGSVHLSDLSFILNKNKINLPISLLKLIASLFVVQQMQGESKVNYEKFLSFLGACFRRLQETGGKFTESQSQSSPDTNLTTNSQEAHLNSSESYESSSAAPVNVTENGDGWFYRSPEPAGAQKFDQLQPNRTVFAQRGYDANSSPRPVYYEQDNALFNQSQEFSIDRDLSRTKRIAEEHLRSRNRVLHPQEFEALRASFLRADRLVRRALSEAQLKEICRQHNFPLPDSVLDEIIRTCCTHRGGGQYDWEQFVEFLEKLQPVNTGLQIGNNSQPLPRRALSPVASWPHAESPLPVNSIPDQAYALGLENPQSYAPATLSEAGNVLYQIRQHLQGSRTREWLDRFEQFASGLYEADETRGALRSQEILMMTRRMNDRLRLFIPELDIDEAIRRAKTPDGRIDLHTYLKALTRIDSMPYRASHR